MSRLLARAVVVLTAAAVLTVIPAVGWWVP